MLEDVILERQAVKRLLEPAEVADVVAFLLGPSGRGFTGSPRRDGPRLDCALSFSTVERGARRRRRPAVSRTPDGDLEASDLRAHPGAVDLVDGPADELRHRKSGDRGLCLEQLVLARPSSVI